MQYLIMLKGLPASGKSTYAKEVARTADNTKRVNKDELRDMVDGGQWSKANEREILELRDTLINRWLSRGYNVIVDDTNFAPQHEQRLRELAQNHQVMFEVKFFDVTVEEAIQRDLKRPNSVGEAVIRKMYNQYLAPVVEQPSAVYVPPAGKPAAIICDIDGTLAHGHFGEKGRRRPYDWWRVGEDDIDRVVHSILMRYDDKYTIILLSGRDSVCRKETELWLEKHNVYYNHLFMRPEHDTRKDSIVKLELFNEHIRDNYQVHFVLDDRDQVVKMWREEGLKVLQVAEGNF